MLFSQHGSARSEVLFCAHLKWATGVFDALTISRRRWSDSPGRDGIFNHLDIIAALQTGNYLQGPLASLAKSDRDAEVDAVFEDEFAIRTV